MLGVFLKLLLSGRKLNWVGVTGSVALAWTSVITNFPLVIPTFEKGVIWLHIPDYVGPSHISNGFITLGSLGPKTSNQLNLR